MLLRPFSFDMSNSLRGSGPNLSVAPAQGKGALCRRAQARPCCERQRIRQAARPHDAAGRVRGRYNGEVATVGDNARAVLERRYLLRDDAGALTETPSALWRRVATALAEAEAPADRGGWAERFEARLASLEFLPNSPTLMNAGRERGQLAACFVLPVGDDLASIFDALKWAALIHQSGGGTGFSFSRLRPRGDLVRTTHGVASGPLSFIRVYDSATETIKQGGVRRGANMAVLGVDHPDVEEFVDAKRGPGLENFNVSVAATDAFMGAAARGERFALRHPRGSPAGELD